MAMAKKEVPWASSPHAEASQSHRCSSSCFSRVEDSRWGCCEVADFAAGFWNWARGAIALEQLDGRRVAKEGCVTEARGAALPSCAGRQELKIVAEKKSHAGEGSSWHLYSVKLAAGRCRHWDWNIIKKEKSWNSQCLFYVPGHTNIFRIKSFLLKESERINHNVSNKLVRSLNLLNDLACCSGRLPRGSWQDCMGCEHKSHSWECTQRSGSYYCRSCGRIFDYSCFKSILLNGPLYHVLQILPKMGINIARFTIQGRESDPSPQQRKPWHNINRTQSRRRT